MRGSRLEFSPGGRGQFFLVFFSPQLILHKSNGEFKRKLSFSRFQRGSNIFQGGGGPNLSKGGGGPIAYFL